MTTQPRPPWNPTKKLNQFQQIVQERFANVVEIYYENHVHKKFLADVYAVIPKGKKCAMWFTNKQCWVFQIAKRPYQPQQPQRLPHKQLEPVAFDDIRMLNMPCMDDAWYHGNGTILYGTCLFDNKRFSVENVHYFCGEKQQNDGSMTRFINFFDYLKQCKYDKELPLQFFMPIMHSSFGAALKDALAITSYGVFCIQHRFLQRNCTEYKNLLMHLADQPPIINTQSFFPMQSHASNASNASNANHSTAATTTPMPVSKSLTMQPMRAFIIKPDVQNDIYYVLHTNDDPITDKTMIAHIPNYKTSVMMNSIFRNIKENRDLDALEESDDEAENGETGHHVIDMNKCVRMTCVFNHRFKRWQPCGCA